MEIILLEKVANLGSLGDIVKVKAGYARNFLIPQSKAKRASSANLAEFEARKVDYVRRQDEILASANDKFALLNEKTLKVAAKAGVDGKLFGSVTSFDIVEAAKFLGVEVKRVEILLPHGPIKALGDYEVDVLLHHDVKAKVFVSVVGEAQ